MAQRPTINMSKTIKDYENMQKYSKLVRKYKVQQPASIPKDNPYLVGSAFAPAVNFHHMRKNSMINRPTFSGSLPYIETHNSTHRKANGSYDMNNGSSPNLPYIGSNMSSSRSIYSPRHS
jgi:hypothetical protein